MYFKGGEMKRIWDSFIEEYSEILDNYPLSIVLEAFVEYEYGSIKGCYGQEKEVFKKYEKRNNHEIPRN